MDRVWRFMYVCECCNEELLAVSFRLIFACTSLTDVTLHKPPFQASTQQSVTCGDGVEFARERTGATRVVSERPFDCFI